MITQRIDHGLITTSAIDAAGAERYRMYSSRRDHMSDNTRHTIHRMEGLKAFACAEIPGANMFQVGQTGLAREALSLMQKYDGA